MIQIIYGGILTILEKIEVRQVIVGKQYEVYENYEEFIKIVKKKKIHLKEVEAGQKIKIEKDLYVDVLWPDSKNMISENSINNNSLVCKLIYKDFSCLFTGDIEEISEKKILNKYNSNLKVLDSKILKVAHHGSKTSTSKDFLEYIKPKISLIGVGKDNNFGHPNEEIIERLENIGSKIYRTDKTGEVILKINKKGNVKIKTKIK